MYRHSAVALLGIAILGFGHGVSIRGQPNNGDKPKSKGKPKNKDARTAGRVPGIGKILDYKAEDGSKQAAVSVGDLIRITLEDKLVQAGTVPDTDVIEGDAASLVTMVKDGTRFVAYYGVEKNGASKVKFTYTDSNGQLIVLLYDFTAKTKTVGRTLDLAGSS